MILRDRDGEQVCSFDQSNLLFVSEARRFKLYLVKGADGENKLLKVPLDRYGNGSIQHEAVFLQYLASKSSEFELEFGEKHDNEKLHYDWIFPVLDRTFLTGEDQGGRQMNLLSIQDADVADFTPLSKMYSEYRVDARTSAWMLGRMLKLLTFIEEIDASLIVHRESIIFEPKMHRLVYIDWINANHGNFGMIRSTSIAESVQTFREWTSWYSDFDYDSGYPSDEKEAQYLHTLQNIEEHSEIGAAWAHRELYKTLDHLWGRNYHPFSYKKLKDNTWHSYDGKNILCP